MTKEPQVKTMNYNEKVKNSIFKYKESRKKRRIFKVGFNITAIALALIALSWPRLSGSDSDFVFAAVNPDKGIIKPELLGQDKQNRPFHLKASHAKEANDKLINLNDPFANITLENGAFVALKSNLGHFNQEEKSVHLNGSVTLFHENGVEFETTNAKILLKKGTAESDEPVKGQGPFGNIESEGFKISNNGNQVVFTGKSRLVLNGDPQKEQ